MIRVAVTGLGVVSPLGCTIPAFWRGLLSGRSAISEISSFDSAPYRTHRAAELKDFSPREALSYARAAARAALADAGLTLEGLDRRRAGVALGTTAGELLKLERAIERRLRAPRAGSLKREVCGELAGSIAARLACELGFKGPNLVLTNACAAGNSALIHGFHKIQSGQADLMLVGGVDVLTRTGFAAFNRILSVAPERCAPFSLERKGLIPGEGCGILLLEPLERARRRGRGAYAELLGYGMSADASHVTQPDAGGVARALADCLKSARLSPAEIDYISAHGTGTPANDRVETEAIKRVFGRRARRIPVSSIKSMLGHAMGAASAFEAIACCLALRDGIVPPTINFTGGDPDCDLDYVPGKARRARLRRVLSNAFAFGGGNTVIALGRPSPAPERAARAPRVRAVVTGLCSVDAKDPLRRAERLLPDADLRFINRPTALVLRAAKLALADAGLKSAPSSTGIILDSSAEFDDLRRFFTDLFTGGPDEVEPRHFPGSIANAIASRTSIVLGLKLFTNSLAGSFPGAESALAAAVDYLRARGKGTILAGGVDGGAALFVVETLEGARRRGARVLAEIVDCRESFAPGAGVARSPGCFRLAKALGRVRRSGRALRHEARGLWGGRISFELRPVPEPRARPV